MHMFANIFMLIGFTYSSQILFFRALYLKKPSFIWPLGYTSVIFAVVMDAILFGYTFNVAAIIGIGLTSSGLLMKLLLDEE